MACLIKAPDASGKGCVSFTTPERDNFIKNSPDLRAAIEALKPRYFVGLHHNWHDHQFSYDPLFDFSMAGDGDLIERDGTTFDRIGLDACNFSPVVFSAREGSEKFWDVLCTSRAVFFKGLPEFFQAVRNIYDRGRLIRVLHLCPVPPATKADTVLHDIRQRFEAQFDSGERRLFNLITMEWDNPFPLDLETLAFFYRSSRIYVHSAPEERRARAGAYAWVSRLPMVSRANVASILPVHLRRRPFWYEYDDPSQMSDAILAALDEPAGSDPTWQSVSEEFSIAASTRRLDEALQDLAARRRQKLSSRPINAIGFDLRLGRHHGIGGGTNQVDQQLHQFCGLLQKMSDEALARMDVERDPELAMATRDPLQPTSAGDRAAVPAEPDRRFSRIRIGLQRLLAREG